MGYSTTLLEKDHHPRFHIGESLLPLSLPYLEDLGVLPEVEAIGLRKYAAEFHSVYHGRHIAFPFAEAVRDDYPYAYEVRRSEFDEVLFRNAEKHGVKIIEGCRVDQANFNQDRLESVAAWDDAGSRINFNARFFVDATGRDTFLASALGSKKKNPKHQSAAIYAHYEGAVRNQGEAEGNIAIYWFDKGWFWMIPLKGGTMSVGAVLKPEYLKSRTVPLEDFMADTIAMCPGVTRRLQHAERTTPVTGTGNYSYRSTRMFGQNYLLVGDAYAFIDPVFSSGVHLALHGAFRASETVATILENPKMTTHALRLYEKDIVRGIDRFAWFIYRVTTPAIRDLFMNPRNFFNMRQGIISVLAGDLFRKTPIDRPLLVFQCVYRIKSLLIRLGLARPVTP
jgi:flavin-dependent dehydrogenase